MKVAQDKKVLYECLIFRSTQHTISSSRIGKEKDNGSDQG